VVALVDVLLRKRSPFALMTYASCLIEATTPRRSDAFTGRDESMPDRNEVFGSYAASGFPAMEALASAVAVMHHDTEFAAKVRAAVPRNRFGTEPRWLADIGTIEITDCRCVDDELGDGENITISFRWPGGQQGTVVVDVDHNMGSLVKDAVVLEESADAIAEVFARYYPECRGGAPLEPAEARARIEAGIDLGDRMLPPFETETWPACRPLVEWVLRHLPTGGTGYVDLGIGEDEADELLDAFIASPMGEIAGVRPDVVRVLADALVGFTEDAGSGDPLRWSPASVEILLDQWLPHSVEGMRRDELVHLPRVLAAFVRFAHQRRGIRPELTIETIAAVAYWSEGFLRRVGPVKASGQPTRRGEPSGLGIELGGLVIDPTSVALRPTGGAFDELDDEDDLYFEDLDFDDKAYLRREMEHLENGLLRVMGGRAALEAVDDTPLPDRPFDWTGVAAPIRPQVESILGRLDAWSVELFDPEVRTIARAVLAAAVARDPGLCTRSSRTDAVAAGILYFLLKRLTRGLPNERRASLGWKVASQKELAAATGVEASLISARKTTIESAVHRSGMDWPSNLHSSQRADVIREKARLASWRPDHGDPGR
jgi:hypothetical protein